MPVLAVNDLWARGIGPSNTATIPIFASIDMRPNESVRSPDPISGWLEFTTAWEAAVATFDNDSFIIVTVGNGSSGAITLKPWLDRPGGLTAGMSYAYRKREIRENIAVTLTGGTNGILAGFIVLGGLDPLGNFIQWRINFMCNTAPPTTWAGGAANWPQFGGPSIGQYMAGNPANVVITSQTNSAPAQFIIRCTDTVNNVWRVVLAGPFPAGFVASPVPTVPPVAGTFSDIVLTNTVSGEVWAFRWNFIANRFDAAPCPAPANPGVPAGNVPDNPADGQYGDQRKWFWRHLTKAYLGTRICVTEDGAFSNTNASGIFCGNAPTNGATINAAGRPTTLYQTGDVYLPLAQVNEAMVQQTSRTYLGTNCGNVTLNVQNLAHNVQTTLGFRLTNTILTFFRVYDGSNATLEQNFVMIDRCVIGAGANNALVLGDSNNPRYAMGCILNDIIGNSSISSYDYQVAGNRRTSTVATQDLVNLVGCCSIFGNGKLFDGFNLDINKQGQDDPLHEDVKQTRQISLPYWPVNGGIIDCGYDVGNITYLGNYRVGGGGGFALPGGQGNFRHDVTRGCKQRLLMGGYFLLEINQHGLDLDNMGNGSRLELSSFYFAEYAVNPIPGSADPQIKTQASTKAFTAKIDDEAGGAGVILTISAWADPLLLMNIGDYIYGAGVANPCIVLNQLSGTPGQAGRYTVDVAQFVTSRAMTASDYNGLTDTWTVNRVQASVVGGVINIAPGPPTIATGPDCVFGADLAYQQTVLVNPNVGAAAQTVGDIVTAFSPLAPMTSGAFSDLAACNHRDQTWDAALLFP